MHFGHWFENDKYGLSLRPIIYDKVMVYIRYSYFITFSMLIKLGLHFTVIALQTCTNGFSLKRIKPLQIVIAWTLFFRSTCITFKLCEQLYNYVKRYIKILYDVILTSEILDLRHVAEDAMSVTTNTKSGVKNSIFCFYFLNVSTSIGFPNAHKD